MPKHGIAQETSVSSSRIIIKSDAFGSVAEADAHLSQYGITVLRHNKSLGYFLARITGDAHMDTVLERLKADERIQSAEPSALLRSNQAALTNDFFAADQEPYFNAINLPQAWANHQQNSIVIVAVLDTGTDYTHPDLAGNMAVNALEVADGTDTEGNGFADDIFGADVGIVTGDPSDANGHGTMVSGIIGAVPDNDEGIAGVARGARLLAVKLGNAELPSGLVLDFDIAEGITYAMDNGARIINISAAGPDQTAVLQDAVTAAVNAGLLVVCSAGNENTSVPQYPAAYKMRGNLAVGATTLSGDKASYSSFGDWVDISAPGGDFATSPLESITSTWPVGLDLGGSPLASPYALGAGTSFSAPIVAGVAALIMSTYPGLSSLQVYDAILSGSAPAQGITLQAVGGGSTLCLDAQAAMTSAASINSAQTASSTGSSGGGGSGGGGGGCMISPNPAYELLLLFAVACLRLAWGGLGRRVR